MINSFNKIVLLSVFGLFFSCSKKEEKPTEPSPIVPVPTAQIRNVFVGLTTSTRSADAFSLHTPFYNQLMHASKRVKGFKMHIASATDPLQSPKVAALAEAFNVNQINTLIANHNLFNNDPTAWGNSTNQALNNQAADMSIGLDVQRTGTDLSIKYTVELYKELDLNNHRLILALVEDELNTDQEGAPASFEHYRVLRDVISTDVTGLVLGNGVKSKGEKITNQITYKLPALTPAINVNRFRIVGLLVEINQDKIVQVLNVNETENNTILSEAKTFEVSNLTYSLGVNVTATWCGPCGQWGIPAFYTAMNQYGSRLIPLKAHASNSGDQFYTPAAAALASFYRITGYPNFIEGITNYQTTVSNWNTAVANRIALTTPAIANADATYRIEARTLQIKVRTQFFTNASAAQYHLAVYPIENGISAPQAGVSGPFVHNYVMRGAADDLTFGKLIKDGTVNAGETFDHSFSFTAPAGMAMNRNNIKLIAVIYAIGANGNPTQIINASIR